MSVLKFYKTHPEVHIPVFATKQSACFDLCFSSAGKQRYDGINSHNKSFSRGLGDGSIYINSQERIRISTGLVFDIPKGYSVRIHPRSGLSYKHGIILINSEGIIDSDYVEEVILLMYNISDNGFWIKNGDRIAQGELVKSEKYTFEEIQEMPSQKTDRVGGIGSTDVKNIEKT